MIGTKSRSIESIRVEKQTYSSESLLRFFILPFAAACLLIPSIYTRACILLILGALIYRQEKNLGLLVPASPGVILWFSSFCSYVIGGIGAGFLFDAWEDFGIRHLDIALLYLGVGFAAYCLGLEIAGAFIRRSDSPARDTTKIVISKKSALSVAGIFVLPVIVRNMVNSPIYDNLVIGTLQSIQYLPIIILAIYLFYNRPDPLTILLLFASAFSIPFSGMILGYGRLYILGFTFSLGLVWLYFQRNSGRKLSKRAKMIFSITPFIVIFLFAILSVYRDTVQFDRTLSARERTMILQNAFQQSYRSENIILDNVGSLIYRLTELQSIELLYEAESGAIKHVGWGMEDLRQILFSWIPKFVYEGKGAGYGRDLMVFYGFTDLNNLPVTILSDSFRHSGVLGVIFIYIFISIASTFVAVNLPRYFGSLGIFLALYFALLHLSLYSADVLSVFTLYLYRFPSSALVIYLILRFTGFLQRGFYSELPREEGGAS